MTTIFCSDIHGSYESFENKMHIIMAKYKDAKIVLGGDYIDGYGNIDVASTLKYIRKLQKDYGVEVLIGNHEDMLLNFYKLKDTTWYLNGAKKTVKSLFGQGFSKEMTIRQLAQLDILDVNIIRWINTFNVDFLNDDGYFVHAYVSPDFDIEKSRMITSYDDKIWNRSLINSDVNNTGKAIIVGHTPIQIVSDNEDVESRPIRKETNGLPIYFCDGGASHFSKPLVCVFENNVLIDYL